LSRHNIFAHENVIAMHRGSGGIGWDSDCWEFGIVRLECADALPVHSDSAGNQVGLEGKGVAIALLDTSDLPRPLQALKGTLECLLLIAGQPELRQ
jgi:hypothetical protein